MRTGHKKTVWLVIVACAMLVGCQQERKATDLGGIEHSPEQRAIPQELHNQK